MRARQHVPCLIREHVIKLDMTWVAQSQGRQWRRRRHRRLVGAQKVEGVGLARRLVGTQEVRGLARAQVAWLGSTWARRLGGAQVGRGLARAQVAWQGSPWARRQGVAQVSRQLVRVYELRWQCWPGGSVGSLRKAAVGAQARRATVGYAQDRSARRRASRSPTRLRQGFKDFVGTSSPCFAVTATSSAVVEFGLGAVRASRSPPLPRKVERLDLGAALGGGRLC